MRAASTYRAAVRNQFFRVGLGQHAKLRANGVNRMNLQGPFPYVAPRGRLPFANRGDKTGLTLEKLRYGRDLLRAASA